MRRIAIIALLLLVLAACTSASPIAPNISGSNAPAGIAPALDPLTPTFTPFMPLADTPVPSLTPTLTNTPEPTPTQTPFPSPTLEPEITLLFTGVIVPARCVQAGIDARGDPYYLYGEVRDRISAADLAVGTLNATISDYPPHTGCIFTYVLVGGPGNADAMADAGFDVMSVATNHIMNCGLGDCGYRAFDDTLDNLRRVNILPVGAGSNLAEAMQPVVVTVKGIRFGIVSLGMVEEMVFAGDNTPGIAVLNDTNLKAAIEAARAVSDVVIAMPHWGPEDTPDPNAWQLDYAQKAVADGADLVVGNHTHVVQAYQEINGVQVFYGLGNFVFDQTWALDHQQGVILEVHFRGTQFTGYELIPTHVDGDGTVHIAGEAEAADVLERIHQASERLK